MHLFVYSFIAIVVWPVGGPFREIPTFVDGLLTIVTAPSGITQCDMGEWGGIG